MRLILTCLMLAASACASAQSYTPIQWAHTGLWGDPARSGEGIQPIVTLIDDRPHFWSTVFILQPDGTTRWYESQGWTDEQCIRGACEFGLFQRLEVNGEPIPRGSMWLQTRNDGKLDWLVVVNDDPNIVRQGTLEQVLAPISRFFGRCGPYVGFSPPRPPADDRFCD